MKLKRVLLGTVKFVVIMAAVLVATWYVMWDVIPSIQYRGSQRGEVFDSAVWKSEHPTGKIQYTRRRRMIYDLGKNHLRTGMPRSEVEALLGAPRGLHGPKVMDYWLGYPPKYFTFDHDILEVFLDEEDKVLNWRVRNT